MNQSQSTNDKALEDAEIAAVMNRGMLTAIAEVRRRDTTFAHLRSAVETLVGRGCDSHGLDFSTYRVRFTETVEDPDLGPIAIAYDWTLDLSRPDSGWAAESVACVDPYIAMMLERL